MTPKIGCVGHDCAECKARKAMRPTVPDNMQDWKGMDGTIAWHLIERHADNWADVGKMMDEWFAANQAQPQPTDPRIAELEAKCADYEAALKELACLGNGDRPGNSIGNAIAQAVLAKHGGAA